MVFFDGDPFEPATRIQAVMLEGKLRVRGGEANDRSIDLVRARVWPRCRLRRRSRVRRLRESKRKAASSKDADAGSKDDEGPRRRSDRWFAVMRTATCYTGTGGSCAARRVLAKTARSRRSDTTSISRRTRRRSTRRATASTPASSRSRRRGCSAMRRSDFEDTIDPFNSRMILALSTGITTTARARAR